MVEKRSVETKWDIWGSGAIPIPHQNVDYLFSGKEDIAANCPTADFIETLICLYD